MLNKPKKHGRILAAFGPQMPALARHDTTDPLKPDIKKPNHYRDRILSRQTATPAVEIVVYSRAACVVALQSHDRLDPLRVVECERLG